MWGLFGPEHQQVSMLRTFSADSRPSESLGHNEPLLPKIKSSVKGVEAASGTVSVKRGYVH